MQNPMQMMRRQASGQYRDRLAIPGKTRRTVECPVAPSVPLFIEKKEARRSAARAASLVRDPTEGEVR